MPIIQTAKIEITGVTYCYLDIADICVHYTAECDGRKWTFETLGNFQELMVSETYMWGKPDMKDKVAIQLESEVLKQVHSKLYRGVILDLVEKTSPSPDHRESFRL